MQAAGGVLGAVLGRECRVGGRDRLPIRMASEAPIVEPLDASGFGDLRRRFGGDNPGY